MRRASGERTRSRSATSDPVGGEEGAHAAHRLDGPWALGIVAELLAEVRYVDVDRPVEGLVGTPAHEVDELLAREHAAGALGEDAQEVELVRGHKEIFPGEPHRAGHR